MIEKPSYYAVLDADVRYDKRLKPMEKLLYAEITALTNMNGKCEAQNAYFAELYEVSNETVSRWVSSLRKCGYIEVLIVYEKDGKTIDKRVITLLTKKSIPSRQKDQYPIDEKVKDNNTLTESNNNPTDSNSKKNIKKEFSFKLKKETEYSDLSDEYKAKLKGYAVVTDAARQFSMFVSINDSKGKKYKNWRSAYNTWLERAKDFHAYKLSVIEREHPKHGIVYQDANSMDVYSKDFDHVATISKITHKQPDPIPTGAMPSQVVNLAAEMRA